METETVGQVVALGQWMGIETGIELLPMDTRLVREDSGYSVHMTGFYSFSELRVIESDLNALNVIFVVGKARVFNRLLESIETAVECGEMGEDELAVHAQTVTRYCEGLWSKEMRGVFVENCVMPESV